MRLLIGYIHRTFSPIFRQNCDFKHKNQKNSIVTNYYETPKNELRKLG